MSKPLPDHQEHHVYRGHSLESYIGTDGFAQVELYSPVHGHLINFVGHSLLELRQTARAYVDKLGGEVWR